MKQQDNQLRYITYATLTEMKHSAEGTRCAVTGITMTADDTVIDHKHIAKYEVKRGDLGINGKGLLRGAVLNQINVFIGKIEKGWARSGAHMLGFTLPEMLRLVANYIESPPLGPEKIVHPSERPPKSRLTKTEYDRICKYWFQIFPRKKKVPKYPKSGIKTSKSGKVTYNAKKTPKWIQWLSRADEIHHGKKEIKREGQRIIKRIR